MLYCGKRNTALDVHYHGSPNQKSPAHSLAPCDYSHVLDRRRLFGLFYLFSSVISDLIRTRGPRTCRGGPHRSPRARSPQTLSLRSASHPEADFRSLRCGKRAQGARRTLNTGSRTESRPRLAARRRRL